MNIQEQLYKGANIQPSSYTAVQVTDFNFDSFQTTTQIFHQIHVQRQMWIMREIPPMKAQTPPRRCLFFRWSVLHYWPIDAKCKSAVANDIAVREVQFQKHSIDGNGDTPEKGLWSPRTQTLITDSSPDLKTLCGATYVFKTWITNQGILRYLQCWVHFYLVFLIFSKHPLPFLT